VFNLTGSEITMILLIALVVLGPEKLPDAVRRFMQTYNELKKMGNGFQSEIKAAFDEPMREMRNTAKLVMDSADPSNLMAEADAERRVRDDADAAIAAESMLPSPVTDDWAAPNQPAPPPPPLPPPGWVPPAERPAVGSAGADGAAAP
jgi:sec-independent protein translocase protein TatB